MKLKLVKIVYGYDIVKDMIAARQTFIPAAEGETVDRDTGEEDRTLFMETVCHYTRQEWETLLYQLRARAQPVEVKKAAEELML